MISKPNTIYEIRYDFDLNGGEIEVPEGCTLKFEGGMLRNGTVKGNGCLLSSHIKIEAKISNVSNKVIHLNWFYANTDNEILKRALICAGIDTLDGDFRKLTISESIYFDEKVKCDMINLNIDFIASHDNQSMFIFNANSRYTGKHGTISNCIFTLVNYYDYKNVNALHYKLWDSTTRGKINDVRIYNFTGYMFLSNSYLQEYEFNRLKGYYCGGFISFNSDKTIGESGSGNLIRIINSGIDDGINENSTIKNIVDFHNIRNVYINQVVIQGKFNKDYNSVIRITNETNVISYFNTCNLWVELYKKNENKILFDIEINKNVYFDANVYFDRIHTLGKNINLDIPYSDNLIDGLIIDEDSFINLNIKYTALKTDNILSSLLSTFKGKANITVDTANCSGISRYNITTNIYYNKGIIENQIPGIINCAEKNHVYVNYLEYYGLEILRIKPKHKAPSLPLFGSEIDFTQIKNMEGTSLLYRIIFRAYPLSEVTEENKSSFYFRLLNNSNILNSTSDESVVNFNENSSMNPDEHIWREYIVNLSVPTINSKKLYILSENIGIDIAVAEIYLGKVNINPNISVNPTNDKKLIINMNIKYSNVGEKENRPSNVPEGFQYFDTTLNKPIWWTGSEWVDSTGATV